MTSARTARHLAWSIPLMPASYYTSSMSLQGFLMFMPFFAMDFGSVAAAEGCTGLPSVSAQSTPYISWNIRVGTGNDRAE